MGGRQVEEGVGGRSLREEGEGGMLEGVAGVLDVPLHSGNRLLRQGLACPYRPACP